jgi:hypothetical protein
MPYIVAWTETRENVDRPTEDFFTVFDTLLEAEEDAHHFLNLAGRDDVVCWAVTRVLDASEPHWISNPDPRIEEIVDEAFAAVFKEQGQ